MAEALHPIELKNVSFRYVQEPVLQDVSYVFGANAVTAVLGRSGSGKSTLLELVNGMAVPQEGTVTLFGAPLEYADVYTARLKMGYVVQDSALFPHITVGRNISLPGAISGQSSIEQERRVRALLETVQLPEVYAAKYPHELSGGEQQRVSLCRAMFLDPPVLLMDEPFSSLDYGTKHALYRHFKDLQAAAPRTVILVTHDWDEAQTLGDAFLWIDRGRIRAHGRMEDLAQLKGEYLASI